MGYDFMVSNTIRPPAHRATLVREDKECLTWPSTNHAPGLSHWTGDEKNINMRAVTTVSSKFHGECGSHFKEYGMVPQVYNHMGHQLGGEKFERDIFVSRLAS